MSEWTSRDNDVTDFASTMPQNRAERSRLAWLSSRGRQPPCQLLFITTLFALLCGWLQECRARAMYGRAGFELLKARVMPFVEAQLAEE
jgi:hypothetical protein